MKQLLTILCLCLITLGTQAQNRILKKVMELKMSRTTDDDMPGTRGAAVAWHPIQKKYYASFAGNQEYPMSVFDATGKRLSEDDLSVMVDTRGIWYDPATKSICGNGYAASGWFRYTLNSAGIPTEYTSIKEEQYQPTDNSVGTYSTTKKMVAFLDGGKISYYDPKKDISEKSIVIHWGRKKGQEAGADENEFETKEGYNSTTAICTGIPKAEIGLLNITNNQIELYDESNGYMQQVLKLPSSAVTNERFNFAYANGIYWLFDIENRTWVGYK